MYASANSVNIVSDNGLSHIRRQAIFLSNAGALSIRHFGINLNGIWIKIQNCHSRKCVWKYRPRNGGHFVWGRWVQLNNLDCHEWPCCTPVAHNQKQPFHAYKYTILRRQMWFMCCQWKCQRENKLFPEVSGHHLLPSCPSGSLMCASRALAANGAFYRADSRLAPSQSETYNQHCFISTVAVHEEKEILVG